MKRRVDTRKKPHITTESNCTSNPTEKLRDKIYLASIVALLSFIGAIGGTMTASYFDNEKWKKETSFSLKKEILSKRTELLERTIKSINRLQILDIQSSTGKYSLIEAESLIRSGKAATPSFTPVVDSVIKIKEAQAELSVVMTLDALQFGPQTKEAVTQLRKALDSTETWWHVEPKKTQALIDAIAAELMHNI